MIRIEDPSLGLRLIGFDRADKRNAIGVELTIAFEKALLETLYRDDIKVLVIHGIGGHFSSGMDMKDFFDSSTRSPEILKKARAATENWRCHLLRQMPQTIISSVEGYCLGGAMPILQCSDWVIAHEQARFGMPEINFGFVPGAQIVKSVGLMTHRKALSYLALTGRLIDSHRAMQWGLVSEVVTDSPLQKALALAQEKIIL
jgi:enoyl-CoA hydratase